MDQARIRRKRSKTDEWDSVPVVEYQLWKRTFSLLEKHRSSDPNHVLLNRNGKDLKWEVWAGDRSKKADAIEDRFFRLRTKLKKDGHDFNGKSLKHIRKTSSSLLDAQYDRQMSELFLGLSPQFSLGRLYIAINPDRLDEPLKWLAKQYGLH